MALPPHRKTGGLVHTASSTPRRPVTTASWPHLGDLHRPQRDQPPTHGINGITNLIKWGAPCQSQRGPLVRLALLGVYIVPCPSTSTQRRPRMGGFTTRIPRNPYLALEPATASCKKCNRCRPSCNRLDSVSRTLSNSSMHFHKPLNELLALTHPGHALPRM